MKQIIKLTENDLHRIIKESVNKILKEGGYIPNDGNHMVGGHYGSWTEEGTCNVAQQLIDAILNNNMIDEEVAENFAEYIEENENAFDIYAEFDVSFDESTGYGTVTNPIYDLNKFYGLEEPKNIIINYTDKSIAKIALKEFKNIISNLSSEDFNINNY